MVLIGVQQDCAAPTAGVIHGMLARLEDGRGFQDMSDRWCVDYFEADLARGHSSLPISGGSATELSVTERLAQSLSVMFGLYSQFVLLSVWYRTDGR